jgi:hypothetical protein
MRKWAEHFGTGGALQLGKTNPHVCDAAGIGQVGQENKPQLSLLRAFKYLQHAKRRSKP